MEFKKNVSITLAAQISIFFIGLISSVIIARTLGPEGKGIFAIATLVPKMLFMFGNLGLSSAIIYFIGKKKYSLQDVSSSIFTLAIILGFGLCLLTILLLNCFSFTFLKGVPFLLIGMSVFILPFNLLISFYNSSLLAKEKIKLYNFIQILPNAIFLTFFLLLLLFSKKTILNAVISQLLASISICLILVFLLRKLTKMKINISVNRKFIKDSLKFGGKAYLANLMTFFTYRLDIFLVNFFLSPIQVGYYSLAVGLAEFLWYIPNATSTILFPRITSLKSEEARKFTPKVMRHILFIIIIAALCLFSFSKFIIKIMYGKLFFPSLIPLWLLLPGVIMLSIGKITSSDLLGRGKPIYATIISAVTLLVTIVLDLWLIPRFGIAGAAIASTIAYSLSATIGLICYLKVSNNRLSEMIIIKRQDFLVYRDTFLKLKHTFCSFLGTFFL